MLLHTHRHIRKLLKLNILYLSVKGNNKSGMLHSKWWKSAEQTFLVSCTHVTQISNWLKIQTKLKNGQKTLLVYITGNSWGQLCVPLCVQNVEFVRTGYGKNTVKVLVIRREGSRHNIIELKADVELTLKSRKDYITGDNSDIIPTDTIKNTVHALAKIKGVARLLSSDHNTFISILTTMSIHRK